MFSSRSDVILWSHLLHLNDLGSFECLIVILFVLKTPLVGLASSIRLDGSDVTEDTSELVPDAFPLDAFFVGLPVTLTVFWLEVLVESLFVDSLVEGAFQFMLADLGFFGGVLPASLVGDRECSLLFNLLFRISCCMANLFALGKRLLSKGGGPGSSGS